jgi:hypothetical protein
MVKQWMVGLLCLVSLASWGCQPAGGEKKGADAAGSSTAAGTGRSSDPGRATDEFLKALFAGETQRAMAMMTDKSRAAAQQAGIEMEAPGSKSATFKITEQTTLEGDPHAAQVWSVITDTNEQGKPESYDIVWLLKRDAAGWAICGMATVLFQHEFVIDFEDANDVIAKRQWAAQQAQRELQAMSAKAPATQVR